MKLWIVGAQHAAEKDAYRRYYVLAPNVDAAIALVDAGYSDSHSFDARQVNETDGAAVMGEVK